MTEQQKEILTAKMLDAPASLSDEEPALIGNDPELRDIYEMSASIATASAARTRFDMADEWARFSPRIAGPRLKMRWIMNVAAALLGVIVASGIAVTLTDNAPTPQRLSHWPGWSFSCLPFGHYAGTLDQGRS